MQEVKIVFPKYKVVLVFLFIFILLLIRPIDGNCEIGSLVDINMSLLAVVCGCNLVYQEWYGDLKDIFKRLDRKTNFGILLRRIVIQWIGLVLVSICFYWFCFLKQPLIENSISIEFCKAVFAVAVSIFFFTCMAVLATSVFKNQWVGMGSVFVIWSYLTSTFGQKLKPELNVMSYSYDDLTLTNKQWITGKCIALGFAVIMLIFIRGILSMNREGVIKDRTGQEAENEN